ncbi:MAG TPA: tetratricopeptide repeat protein [Vicinamibacterales bacterium]|nr:tetratricopeptide repeat protein [Vicinamibacterales bacterium]
MRGSLLAGVVVAIAGVAGALAYSEWANEREFDRQIARGDEAVAVDRPFQAIEAYSGAIARNPESVLAHIKRGSVYYSQNQLDDALRDLRRATALDPSAVRAIELLGDVNVGLGRGDRAIEHYESFVEIDDRNSRVLYKLGLARYRNGRIQTALEPLQQALAIEPSLGEAYYVLGLIQRDLDQLPAARKSLEEAARRSPATQTAAREALADVYALEGEHSRAITELEAVAALDPSRPERIVALGLAQARAGREDAAVMTLSRAVERFPDDPTVYAALGHVWLTAAERRGDGVSDRVALNKALEALTQAASHRDASGETFAELGRALLLAGDVRAAERALRQATLKLPVPPEAYLQLADVTGRAGRIQDARDALLKYATLIGDDRPLTTVAVRIGDYSVRLGDPALAMRWFDRAIDEGGANTALQLKLAEAAWRAGDVVRAHQVIDEALSAEPGNVSLRQMKRRLPPT